ncbi:hypothetical protein IFM89_007553 [Coptis chinensis]|uniref:At4g14310 8-bladed propeller domain-containing protein n=1 Tax=Coptis chinensis TaxID=261450 RepID=A0A835LX20_9MAGN|nr:hypothetical protein IFM89_007553 [Coptis chinensis]
MSSSSCSSTTTTSTVRRLKPQGGSSSKPQTPNPQRENKKPNTTTTTRSISATRSSTLSGQTQKPFIKPIPKIDKSSVTQIKENVRWSTSSVPRGRSSSPSDFTRILSDRMSSKLSKGVVQNCGKLEKLQSQKGNLVGRSKFECGGIGVSDGKSKVEIFIEKNVENGVIGSRRSSTSKFRDNKNDEKGVNGYRMSKSIEVFTDKNDEKVGSGKSIGKHLNGVKVLGNSNLNNGNGAILGLKDKCYVDQKARNAAVGSESCKQKSGSDLESKVAVREGGLGTSVKVVKGKVLESQKESVDSEKRDEVRVGNKYSSKLHEKLAFLEGKVKRIASDIMKTKEMLDMNNPDTSKTIISDIQVKISGIEKAMVNVVEDKQKNLDLPEVVDQRFSCLETSKSKQVGGVKPSVRDLNSEELEARLFPHHKLLRGRTTLSTSLTSSQSDPPQSSGDSMVEDMVLSPIDENSIAQEFLESLNKKASKVSKRNEHADMQFHEVQETDGPAASAAKENYNKVTVRNIYAEIKLTTDETIEEFDDDQENRPETEIEEMEDSSMDQLNEIGQKTSTGGWFVSEGESVLLAHDDGSCTFYDITNSEVKAEYNPPSVVSPNLWGDCWLIRATDSDGCSGRYVVAASSGSTLESGFCAWDFYTKDVRAFHVEDERLMSSVRTVLGPLPNTGVYKRSALSTNMSPENQQWWYKPCGHLLASISSSQRVVSVYDIRDGEQVLNWEIQRPVITMDHSSPLHWRNRGKVVIAEAEAISLWDVNSLTPQALLSIASSGRKVSALHVNNTDAELGGGVRRRVSSSEVEGHDGVFCTQDTINVLDFRLPSGVGLKISKIGVSVQSVFSRGDSIFLGCTNGRLAVNELGRSCVQQFSLRKGRLVSTYALPESNSHSHYSAISQVWGNSDFVMGICGLGLSVFDASKNEGTPSIAANNEKLNQVRDVIGPADLYSPSFDYLASRVLVISKDRPALWRYLS